MIQAEIVCPTCAGAGTSTYICLQCDGAGKVLEDLPQTSECSHCRRPCRGRCQYCNASFCLAPACARAHARHCVGFNATVFHDEIHARSVHFWRLYGRSG